jgi:hemerythrin
MNYTPELITWSSTFSFGIKLIDKQHKEFVDLVNEMFLHATGNEEQEHEYFSKVIRKAIRYIKVHFATEEKIMRAIHYPGYTEHKRCHDCFILDILDNIHDYETEKHYSLFYFTKLLKNWVLSHIGIMDKQYYIYIKNMMALRKTSGRSRVAAKMPVTEHYRT